MKLATLKKFLQLFLLPEIPSLQPQEVQIPVVFVGGTYTFAKQVARQMALASEMWKYINSPTDIRGWQYFKVIILPNFTYKDMDELRHIIHQYESYGRCIVEYYQERTSNDAKFSSLTKIGTTAEEAAANLLAFAEVVKRLNNIAKRVYEQSPKKKEA